MDSPVTKPTKPPKVTLEPVKEEAVVTPEPEAPKETHKALVKLADGSIRLDY